MTPAKTTIGSNTSLKTRMNFKRRSSTISNRSTPLDSLTEVIHHHTIIHPRIYSHISQPYSTQFTSTGRKFSKQSILSIKLTSKSIVTLIFPTKL
jgi:hypothetical protein